MWLKYGAISILVFMGVLGVIGCSQSIQPKAWLSVEKAPMRVILVDNERDISPQTVHMVIDHLNHIKYENYQFNSNTGVTVSSSVDDNRHSSSSTVLDLGGK